MTRKSERESDSDNHTLPVFYLLRLKDNPEVFYGRALDTPDSPSFTLCLFTSEPDALECVNNRCSDPENIEVVRSDELGGILAVLERPDAFFTHVAINPPPTTGLRVLAWEMTGFVDALKSAEA